MLGEDLVSLTPPAASKPSWGDLLQEGTAELLKMAILQFRG